MINMEDAIGIAGDRKPLYGGLQTVVNADAGGDGCPGNWITILVFNSAIEDNWNVIQRRKPDGCPPSLAHDEENKQRD
jgi:hypothetical protein